MNFIQATNSDLNAILIMLKNASITLHQKGIDQWGYWQKPPQEKINWLKQGIASNEFFFVHVNQLHIGMFRLLFEDELYWGKQVETAGYIHSLVIKPNFKGNQFGSEIIKIIEQQLIDKNIKRMRLDCVAYNKGLCAYYEELGFKKVGEVQMPHSLNNLYEKEVG